jgi:hypothetical protein
LRGKLPDDEQDAEGGMKCAVGLTTAYDVAVMGLNAGNDTFDALHLCCLFFSTGLLGEQ